MFGDAFRHLGTTGKGLVTNRTSRIEGKQCNHGRGGESPTGENATEEEPYGVSIMATDNIALASMNGAHVDVEGTFAFTGENHEKYGYDDAVITTAGRYTVINEPVSIVADDVTIPWTYEFASAHADKMTDPDNWTPNALPIKQEITFKVDNLGDMDLYPILVHNLAAAESYVELNGEKITADAPVLTFEDRDLELDEWIYV